MLCIRTHLMIASSIALLSASNATAQGSGVGVALRELATTDSVVTLLQTGRQAVAASGTTPFLRLPAQPRADACNCTRRIVVSAIVGGTLGALIGYQLAKFPDGGTDDIRRMGAVLGFAAGAISAVMPARQYPR